MDLKRTVSFKFQDRNYQIEFPTVGQYLEIENEKIRYSKGNWGGLISSIANSSFKAVQIIECIANLKILCPQLFEDFKIDVLNIDILDFSRLVAVYQKEIKPWYNSWFKEFNDILSEIDEDEKKIDEDEKEDGV